MGLSPGLKPLALHQIADFPGFFGAAEVQAIALVGNQRINSSGFTGGLTAGYNWQVSY
jgi:outer membrane immunogenic protein